MPDRQYTFRYFKEDRMVSTNHIQAESDTEAVSLAKEAMFGFEVEVWDDGRFVYGSEGRTGKVRTARPRE